MKQRPTLVTVISLTVVLALCTSTENEAVANGLEFTVVAQTGELGPIAGTNFGSLLWAPVLNDAGQLAVEMHLAPAQVGGFGLTGIFFGQPGQLQLIATENQPAPDTDGRFVSLNSPMFLTDRGEMAFSGRVQDGPGNYLMRWLGRSGVIQSFYPRDNSGFFITVNQRIDFTIGPSGHIAYQSFIPGTGGETGIYAGRPGSMHLIVQGLNTNSATFDFDSAGALVTSTPTGLSYSKPGEEGWSIGSGILQPDGLRFRGASDGRINERQEVAFFGTLQSSSDRGIWIRRNGQHRRMADAGGGFDLRLAESGDVAYRAGSEFQNITNSIGAGGDNGQRIVARVGQAAPGYEPETVISQLNEFALNDAGLVAVQAIVSGPGIDTSNDMAVFAEVEPGQLVRVVYEGQQLELSPGVSRTIAGFQWTAPLYGEHSAGWNALNQLAVTVSFTDGRQAMLLYNVPEPPAIVLAILACAAFLGAIRHRTRSQKPAAA